MVAWQEEELKRLREYCGDRDSVNHRLMDAEQRLLIATVRHAVCGCGCACVCGGEGGVLVLVCVCVCACVCACVSACAYCFRVCTHVLV